MTNQVRGRWVARWQPSQVGHLLQRASCTAACKAGRWPPLPSHSSSLQLLTSRSCKRAAYQTPARPRTVLAAADLKHVLLVRVLADQAVDSDLQQRERGRSDCTGPHTLAQFAATFGAQRQRLSLRTTALHVNACAWRRPPTSFSWPMRWQRAMACRSFCGFQSATTGGQERRRGVWSRVSPRKHDSRTDKNGCTGGLTTVSAMPLLTLY